MDSSDGAGGIWRKAVFYLGTGAAIGTGVYVAYKYFNKQSLDYKDEGFEDISKTEDIPEKRVLVLGLDGAGKSSLLLSLKGQNLKEAPKPTEGFNVMCINTDNMSLNIWEIGGAENVRQYWSNFVQDTDVLVFVVDSSDESRLPEAYTELHKLMGDERLKAAPVVIVASKQDKLGVQTPEQIQSAVGMDNVSPREHRVHVIGTQVAIGQAPRGVDQLESLLLRLASS